MFFTNSAFLINKGQVSMTGSEYIIHFLKSSGVKTVFAYPGANVLALYDDIAKSDIRAVLTRHEQGAAHAAAGYAKASGQMGVCIATSGPGATNLVTGIADAYLDSAPMLVITGQVDSGVVGRDAFQEADIMGMTIPITKHNYLVKTTKELTAALGEAYIIANTGRKGPVLVDITHNVLISELDTEEYENSQVRIPRVRENNDTVSARYRELEIALEHSYRPLILVGGGVISSGASGLVGKLARISEIPIATTLMGRGVSAECQNLGMAGIFGTAAANEALNQCDLLIAVGMRFSDRTIVDFGLCSRSRTIIHCDIDSAEISKNVTADIGIVSDAAEFLEAMCEIASKFAASKRSVYRRWREQIDIARESAHIRPSVYGALTSTDVINAIRRYSDKSGGIIYVTDVGDSQMAAARGLVPMLERGFITSGGLGVMGFALPASVGSAYAAEDFNLGASKIIAVCGDGGFQMTMQELAGMKKSPLPIKLFIFDNFALGMVARISGGNSVTAISEQYSLDDNPDFRMIASAYGIKTYTVCDSDISGSTIDEKISDALDSNEHAVIVCQTRDL